MVHTNHFLNLTEDIKDDILITAVSYWLYKDITASLIIPFKGLLGNRVRDIHDTDNLVGLTSKGKDFRNIECRSNMSLINPNDASLKAYIDYMRLKHGISDISSMHFMDEKGFIQWHTNQFERPGFNYRIYVTYNDKEGSLFKYILPDTDVVITYVEPKGWYAKVFNIEKELIHCVESHANRYSIGLYF